MLTFTNMIIVGNVEAIFNKFNVSGIFVSGKFV
jgi:hypothetical protein